MCGWAARWQPFAQTSNHLVAQPLCPGCMDCGGGSKTQAYYYIMPTACQGLVPHVREGRADLPSTPPTLLLPTLSALASPKPAFPTASFSTLDSALLQTAFPCVPGPTVPHGCSREKSWLPPTLGRLSRGPRAVRVPIPGTWDCVSLYNRRDFAAGIKLRTLGRGDYPG